MENKYIIASTAAEIISKRTGIPLHELVNIVAEVPAADVVEVVRCKDCKYYERNGCYHPNYDDICEKLMPKEPDDYCNYGERT